MRKLLIFGLFVNVALLGVIWSALEAVAQGGGAGNRGDPCVSDLSQYSVNTSADIDKAGLIVFTDDFNGGRKPDWKVIRGAWGDVGGMLRATAINNGATRSDRPTLVTTLAGVPGPAVTLGDNPTDITTIVVSTLSLADCTVDVDSTPFIPTPEGEEIIPWPQRGLLTLWTSTGSFNQAVLRYTDERNYILAGYHPGDGGALFIYEVVNDVFHRHALKPTLHFYKAGPLHLTATASGPTVTVTVTDGLGNTDTISGEVTTLLGPGSVGLFHDDGPGGLPPTSNYDNFVVRAPGRRAATPLDGFFARGAFFINERDSLVSKSRIDDPAAAHDYYDRAMHGLAERGFNLAIVYWTPFDHREMVLEGARKHGLKVVLHLPEVASLIRSGEQVNTFDFAGHVTRPLRGHPALAGYYIFDEAPVEPGAIVRAELVRLALEVADPDHPSLGYPTNSAGTCEDVLRAVELPVLLLDAYPLVSDWSGGFSDYIARLERGRRNAGDRPLWIAPQAFGKPNAWKTPAPEEIRAQVWLALAHGAKGLVHFIYQSTTGLEGDGILGLVDMDLKPIDGRLDELERLNADLDRLSPTLLSLRPAEVAPPEVPGSVVARAFSGADEARYVIVANTDVENPITFAWTGPGATDVLTGREIGPEIELAAGDGKVLELFGSTSRE
jgi:hypothetical protein